MDTNLDHCMHDPAHCLTPGLFRSFSRGARSSEKLDVTYKHHGYTIRFMGFEPLGADDLRFLQGIVAFTGFIGETLTENPTNEIPLKLRAKLLCSPSHKKMESLVVTFRSRKLLKELGMSIGGSSIKGLQKSLRRMSSVTVNVENELEGKSSEVSYHLLSYCAIESMAEVSVALNPFLADTILGEGNFVRIELSEVRKIKSAPTRLVHQRLCGIINPGRSVKVGIEKIVSYAWGESRVSEISHRKRIERAGLVIEEMGKLGWKFDEYRRGFFKIKRPK